LGNGRQGRGVKSDSVSQGRHSRNIVGKQRSTRIDLAVSAQFGTYRNSISFKIEEGGCLELHNKCKDAGVVGRCLDLG
jgi:hypothetical protein